MLGPKAEHNASRVGSKLFNEGITSENFSDDLVKPILDGTTNPGLWNLVYIGNKEKIKAYIKFYEREARLRAIPEKDLLNLIEDERRLDLLTSAIEGGSNYWYYLKGHANEIIDSVQAANNETCFVDRMFAALKAGHYIPVHDLETDDLLGGISMLSIREGEALMLKKHPIHFAQIISGDDDAETADVWFQYAIMGETVYG